MKLFDWQILQQEDGYASVEFLLEYENWLINPKIPEEIRVSKTFLCLDVRVVEEDTGKTVVDWQKTENLGNGFCKCIITDIPKGGLYFIERRCHFVENGVDRYYPAIRVVSHIGVGDVYLITGQSNAAGVGLGIMHEKSEIGVHAFKQKSFYKQQYWDIATHPLTGNCEFASSPFLEFGKYLHRKLGYPIGLIPRAVGGTYLKQWIPGGNLFEDLKEEVNEYEFKVKGIIWYQGCNEAMENDTEGYFDNFKLYVQEIRNLFKNPDLPIFTFQLNRHLKECNALLSSPGFSLIREIQRTVPQMINNTYVIPTIDAKMMSDDIHNSRAANIVLGTRLAEIMIDEVYYLEKSAKVPDILSAVQTSPCEVSLTFSNVSSNLYAYQVLGDNLPIELEDKKGTVGISEYTINKDTINIKYCREILGEAYVSGMSGNAPFNIIIDHQTQMPVLSFYKVRVTK